MTHPRPGSAARALRACAASVARALLALAAACTAQGVPALERVEPNRGLGDRRNAVVLIGRHLDPPLFERQGELQVAAWSGSVAGRPLEEVVWISSERVEAVVPAGLPPGIHDISIHTEGREIRLVAAFSVVVAVGPRLDAAHPEQLPAAGGEVRLSGAGLYPGTEVSIGGLRAEARWVSDLALEVRAPPAPAGPGAARVEVRTPVGIAWREDLLWYAAP